jgi:hypothetical protein
MSQTAASIQSATDPLPLANRYSAAWIEHGTRVAQRQSVIQMYLTAAGVIFGFWFTSKNRDDLSTFFTIAVTALTLSSASLIWMHNRVMQHLTWFMKNCEQYASKSIKACGPSIDLFYFSHDGSDTVKSFHSTQRTLHRIVLSVILATTNLSAIVFTWNKIHPIISAMCLLSVAAAIIILFLNLRDDRSLAVQSR